MSEILSSFADSVNRRAYQRYLKNCDLSKHKHDIQEQLRNNDLDRIEQAKFLQSNGLLEHVNLKYRTIPSGVRSFAARVARSEASERSAAAKPISYLYEGLEEPLVNHAKSQSRFLESIDEKTGEIHRLSAGFDGEIFVENFDIKSYRAEQYALQSESRELLKRFTRNNGKFHNHPVYRVCNCLRNAQSKLEGVGIVKTSSQDKVRLSGLQTCGSVWHCPVCAARISEFRAGEIRYMCDMWQQAGKGVIFVTNTVRHGFDDDLRLLLDVLFGTVWNRYINHRAMKRLRQELGYLGRVRAVEVTHGKNGWHPHIHEIWLIEKPLSIAELNRVKRELYKIWNVTLVKAGLKSVTLERGVTVQPGSNAADYVAKFGRLPKWNMGKELAKSHLKHGKQSRTPFDLLRDSLAGDLEAGRLFIEYAIAFSGKRQLYFSTGLRDYFCLSEKKDEEITQSQDDVIETISVLTNDEWKLVLIYGDRSTLLSVAESGGKTAINVYLSAVKQQKFYT